MLFKRRNEEDLVTRTRVAIIPRRNYARSARYYMKRILRINATPHKIAMGVAAGTFASFTPFMGFHFILSFSLAFVLRGSMIAAALGTAVGNPLTFPAIWASTHAIGSWVLGSTATNGAGRQFGRAFQEQGFYAIWEPFIMPMLVGAIPMGLIAGALFYTITRFAVGGFRARRSARAKLKAHRELQEAANALISGREAL